MAGGSRRKKIGPILCPMPFGLRLNPLVLTLLQKNYRFVPYKRVRTIDDCKRILLSGEPGRDGQS